MQKDDKGVWSFTTEPLGPDYYGYSFTVDGVRTIDLNNPLMKYNLLTPKARCMSPARRRCFGKSMTFRMAILHRHFYKSAAAGDERAYYVYTPPGYNASGGKRIIQCCICCTATATTPRHGGPSARPTLLWTT